MSAKTLVVTCGMYAFSPALQHAWTALFSLLPRFLPDYANCEIEVSFNTDDDIYLDPNLLIGHTCGYPYLKNWSASHQPVCVPQFAIDGCVGKLYSSWFISPAENGVADLESARGKCVGVSSLLSNSGMNVLRHAIAELAGGEKYFGEVILTGSHLTSIDIVARGEIDLAAIDVVTFALMMAHDPELQNRIRIIGQSAHTSSLPFMAATASRIDAAAITDALNLCVTHMDARDCELLKLTGFSRVSAPDYDSIGAIEQYAFDRAYPEIV